MNELLDLFLDLLTAPRMLVSLVAGVVAAVLLAAHVPWFSGSMGLAMVIVSPVAGMVWGARAEQVAQRRAARGQRASRVFLALALCAAGLAWMFMGRPLVESLEGRFAVLACAPFAVGGLYSLVLWRPVPIRPLLFATASL
ncbi:hypothetical protein PMI14_05352 [Acidovorax sp. CF316]|uniref:hypothetical protein n=1 Tax=Acidovorax sp. CF316 TaxID=1144317 RepID=UPI00026BD430|nr:hypothetical protein [Acidovorax sp. CF316]EJE50066.1 hypothetical protein PMI14_05352 [Acidovorax sp. CF316]